MSARPSTPRAIRGLFLGFLLSFLNLAGAFLALLALGGLDEWSGWQFIGFFGMLEVATGIAFIFGPNVWRLPVAEANTSDRTRIRFAASTIFIPHWAAGAKVLAGVGMLGYAATRAGVGPATIGVAPLVGLIAIGVLALSAAVARFGVERPDLDVFYLMVKRPGHADYELPGASISGTLIQLVINIGAFPAVKVLPPSVFYRPEVGASPGLLGVGLAVAVLLTIVAWLTWRDRLSWRAPREQQREAEQMA